MYVGNNIPGILSKVGTMTNKNIGGFYLTHIYDADIVKSINNVEIFMWLTRYLVCQ